MTFIEGEIIIARPAGAVFDFAADQRNEPRYNPRMVRAQKVTGGPVGKGTVFRSAVRAMGQPTEMRSELTGYRRPAWLASRTTMARADIVGTLNFAPVPGGTRMRWAWVVRPKGAARLLTPVISRIGRRQERAIWTGMKRCLEAEEGLPMTGDRPAGWTTGRIIALAAGSVLLLISLALIAGGGTLVWADQEQVHAGYVTTSSATYSTRGFALASDAIDLHGLGLFVDEVRIRIASSDPSRPLFAGIAASGDVERYLGDVSYTTVRGHGVTDHPGTGIPAAPAAALPWAERVQGTGTLTLTWAVRDGDWTVVVMNADASPGLSVRADAGISALALPWLAGELLAAGLLTGVAAGALIVVPVRLASRRVPGATLS